MLHQLHKFDRNTHFILACSGGVDSMAALDFLRRGDKKFTIAYFDHDTGNREGALSVISEYTIKHTLKVEVGKISSDPKPKHLSPEEHWRNERYRWLVSLGNSPIVTCHHLNDVAEGWIFSSLHGNPKCMNYQTILSYYGQSVVVYRPFLTNTKQDLIDWCIKHDVKWFEDTSNTNVKFPRNRIRHNILPEALKVNPGLLKVLKKKIIANARQQENKT